MQETLHNRNQKREYVLLNDSKLHICENFAMIHLEQV